MKISVITVCFDSVKTIERAIKSVISQSYPELEYIIIDGGSTDGTVSIIKRYEPYISYWVSERDNGIYDAMNKGIAKATGEIIAFLNSDDWYEESALEKAADYFKRFRSVALAGKINVLQKGRWEEYRGSFDEIDENIRIGMTYRHPATFVSRELFDRFGGFDTRYKIAADYEWMLRIYDGGIKVLRVNTVFTNFSSEGVSSVEAERTIQEAQEIALRGLERCSGYSAEEKDGWKKKINDFYRNQMDIINVKKLISDQQVGKYPIFKKLMLEYLTQKTYIVWGIGNIGNEVYGLLMQLEIEVKAFIDRKAGANSEKFLGISVRPPELLDNSEIIIVASIEYEDEIVSQLKDRGFQENSDYILYSRIRQYMITIYSSECRKVSDFHEYGRLG